MSNASHALTRAFHGIGSWWMRLAPKSLVPLVVAFLVLKNGVVLSVGNAQNFFIPAAQALPAPTGYFSASLGNLLLSRALGVDTVTEWMALHGVLLGLAIIVGLILCYSGTTTPSNVTVLIVVSATATNTLFSTIGMYDPFTYVGGLLLVLARQRWLHVLGAVLMCLGNPEQAVVAGACLALISMIPPLRIFRSRAIITIALSGAWWLLVQVWLVGSGAGSRVFVLAQLLGESVTRFLADPSFAIWSWFGCGWLMVLGFLALQWRSSAGSPRSMLFAVAGLLLVPAIVTVATVDGARVFGLVAFPAFLACSIALYGSMRKDGQEWPVFVGLMVFLLCVTPSVTGTWGLFGSYAAGPVNSVAAQLLLLLHGIA